MKTRVAITDRLVEAGIVIEHGVALPTTLEALQSVLALAEECDARLLPLGSGTQVGAWNSDWNSDWQKMEQSPVREGYDLALSVRAISGNLQYDPAEGVVVAPAGMLWADLQAQVAEQGQVLSPQLPSDSGSTVGGVIAAGISSHDRDFYGGLRHQVLGVQVLLADGSGAQCGGRLVKNVTGFALQTLFTGSRGQLGLILEVSLRVWPKPAATRVWPVLPSDVRSSLRAWQRLRAECIPGTSVRFECEPGGRTRWHVVAQGTEGAIRDIEARVLRAVDVDPSHAEAATVRTEWEQAWCTTLTNEALWVQCQPSDAQAVMESLQRAGTPWAEALHWWGLPELAEWRGSVASDTNPNAPWRAALEANLAELPCHWHWLGQTSQQKTKGGPSRSKPLQAAQEALRLEFDPKRRWQARTPSESAAEDPA